MLVGVSLPVLAKPGNSTKTVAVEIELEELPNTDRYELEVQRSAGKQQAPTSYSQKAAAFKIKLEVGNYQVRTRIKSMQGEVGPWSDWSELLARPEEVSAINIPNSNFSIRKNQLFADVKLQWEKAAGAEKYIVWVENQFNNTIANEYAAKNDTTLKLKAGEYKIGIQSVSKDGIKSKIKYADNPIFIGKTMLPKIKVRQITAHSFGWDKQSESVVKIEVYRKAFFGEKFIKVQTVQQNGENWFLGSNLQPGEYRIDFQYISESFENGPIEAVNFIKKPDETHFSKMGN